MTFQPVFQNRTHQSLSSEYMKNVSSSPCRPHRELSHGPLHIAEHSRKTIGYQFHVGINETDLASMRAPDSDVIRSREFLIGLVLNDLHARRNAGALLCSNFALQWIGPSCLHNFAPIDPKSKRSLAHYRFADTNLANRRRYREMSAHVFHWSSISYFQMRRHGAS
jgi:hypothetical protein